MGFFSRILGTVARVGGTLIGGPAVGAIAGRGVSALTRTITSRPGRSLAIAGGAAALASGVGAVAGGGTRRRRRRRSAKLTVREESGLHEIEATFGKNSDAARYARRRLASRIIRAL